MLAGIDALERGSISGEVVAAEADEDVHGALEAALIEHRRCRARRQAARRPQSQRPDRHARAPVPQATTPRRSASSSCTSSTRSRPRPTRTARRSCPVARTSSTRSPCCSRTTCSRTAGRSRATSSGSSTGRSERMSRRTAVAPSPGRPSGSTRHPSPAISVLARARRQLDRRHREPRRRRRVRVHRGDDRHRPLAHRRRGHPLEHPRVRVRHARRRLLHRLVDHAAEEEPRHRRARARQVRPTHRQPHRPARDAQGAPARVQPRPAGGQGAGLRLGRDARGAAAGVHRHDRDADASTPSAWPSSRRPGSRSRPMSPSGS